MQKVYDEINIWGLAANDQFSLYYSLMEYFNMHWKLIKLNYIKHKMSLKRLCLKIVNNRVLGELAKWVLGLMIR